MHCAPASIKSRTGASLTRHVSSPTLPFLHLFAIRYAVVAPVQFVGSYQMILRLLQKFLKLPRPRANRHTNTLFCELDLDTFRVSCSEIKLEYHLLLLSLKSLSSIRIALWNRLLNCFSCWAKVRLGCNPCNCCSNLRASLLTTLLIFYLRIIAGLRLFVS